MKKLKTLVKNLSNYIECGVTMGGDARFDISDVYQLRDFIECISKEITEMEKKLNYTKEAENFNKPEDRKIEGKAPASSRVEHPSHYTWLKEKCGIEVIDITRHLNFNIGNVVKYVLRAGHKSEEGMSDRQKQIEDLQKAAFYIGDEVKRLKEEKV